MLDVTGKSLNFGRVLSYGGKSAEQKAKAQPKSDYSQRKNNPTAQHPLMVSRLLGI